MLNQVFFYGTIMRGYSRYEYPGIKNNRIHVKRGRVKGILYDIGDYPAMVKADRDNEENYVYGEIHEFSEAEKVIKIIDRIEKFNPNDCNHSLFVREKVAVFLESGITVEAWTYFYNKPLGGATRIESGSWRKAKKA